MKKTILLLALVLGLQTSQAQSYKTYGKEFWFTFLENLDLIFNGDPDFSVYIYSEESGEGTISAPATGLSIPVSYEANVMKKVLLPSAIYYAMGSEEIKNLGLKVSLNTDAQVFVYHYRIYFSEASLVYPVEALGTEYRVVATDDLDGGIDSPSAFVIVATEDATEIEITPSVLTFGLHPENIPFIITMNAGQIYQVQASGDLSGTKVESLSDKKIAVFGGAKRANIDCLVADSHLYDQLLPVEHAANTYPLIPFKDQGYSKFKVIATEDNTQISLNTSVETTINAGEFYEFNLETPSMLNTDKSVHVVQFNPSQECVDSNLGDPSMLTLASTPMRIFNTGIYNFDRFTSFVGYDSKRYITLFTEAENATDVFINGEEVSPQFIPFPSNEMYSYAMIELDTGAMILDAYNGAMAYAYGFGDFDAYTYHLSYASPDFTPTTEVTLKENLLVWPQPFDGFINLHNKGQHQILKIQLHDVNGRLLSELADIPAGASAQWVLEGLSAGVYFLSYEIMEHRYTVKLIGR